MIILLLGACILETLSNDKTVPNASCWLSTLAQARPVVSNEKNLLV